MKMKEYVVVQHTKGERSSQREKSFCELEQEAEAILMRAGVSQWEQETGRKGQVRLTRI